jgi:hypothetical protein
MTSDAVKWSYALAPDVQLELGNGGALLCTATTETRIEGGVELRALEFLRGAGSSEAELDAQIRRSGFEDDLETRCAALLYRLDRLGLLARTLSSGGRRLATCVPLRPPTGSPPESPLERQLRLSPQAHVRVEGDVISVETPGSWARLIVHDRDLLPLLHDLAVGRSPSEIAALMVSHPAEAILAVLTLMGWCGLLGAREEEWSGHDLLFHARTRRGYARIVLGKRYPAVDGPAPR